jgi:protoporphyrinogen oxidase
MQRKTAVIIGGGPAGLTAAYELVTRSDIQPLVIEQSSLVGGISRTERYRGNHIDIGGHRFFSKSDRVMNWWLGIMPMQQSSEPAFAIQYQGQSRDVGLPHEGLDPETTDRVMLIRPRKSRIYWRRKLFDYPLSFSVDTIRKMGLLRLGRAGLSYLHAAAFPVAPEQNLEDFIINRFGRELYDTFFKSYTEKVWGVPCNEIPADWGAQRIKGLSILKALKHALMHRKGADVSQKGTETSLIERFLYPKFGPGQMWEIVADEIRGCGGEVLLRHKAVAITTEEGAVKAVTVRNEDTGQEITHPADYVFSGMPIRELVEILDADTPASVRDVASGLMYRDFFTVGLLVEKMKLEDPQTGGRIRDNWIYIQEPDVLLGRLQIFNNWSPYLVADPSKTWLGLEYFCYESDEIWSRPDPELIELGTRELGQIGIIDPRDALDGCVIRVKKTYPAYFGTYTRFNEVRDYLDRFENLFCVGRNGQHRYNNQDHSMLTAMLAVDNILAGVTSKKDIWEVNTEEEYHETK